MKSWWECINVSMCEGVNGASNRIPPHTDLVVNNPSRDVPLKAKRHCYRTTRQLSEGFSDSQMVVDLTIVIYVKHTVRDAYGPSSVGWGLQGIYTPRSILIYPPMCQITNAEINQGKGSWSPRG